MANKVSFQLTQEEQSEVNSSIEKIENILAPKLITLSPEERKELAKMGDKTVAFVNKALEYAQTYPDYMPSFINVGEAKMNFEAVNTLRNLFTPLERLCNQVDDTMMVAGSEAYTTALSIYKVLKNAANMGQPGADEASKELSNRFPRGKRKNESFQNN